MFVWFDFDDTNGDMPCKFETGVTAQMLATKISFT